MPSCATARLRLIIAERRKPVKPGLLLVGDLPPPQQPTSALKAGLILEVLQGMQPVQIAVLTPVIASQQARV